MESRKFKYVAADNVQHLLKETIRFTQPDALNDPFEMKRFREQHIEDAAPGILAAPSAATLNIIGQITKHPTQAPVAAAFDAVQDIARAGQTFVDRVISWSPVSMMSEVVKASQPRFAAKELTKEKLAELRTHAKELVADMDQYGILSLTEHNDDLLMWAHYAQEHRGAVFEIDVDDEAFCRGFTRGTAPSDGADEWRAEVSYPDERPRPPVNQAELIASFFQKSRQWLYEHEFRIIRLLKSRTKVAGKDANNHDICLFRLPAHSIKGLIFGARFDENEKKRIVQSIRRRPKLKHVKLSEAHLGLGAYGLEIEPVAT